MFACNCLNILIEAQLNEENNTKELFEEFVAEADNNTDDQKTNSIFNTGEWKIGKLTNITRIYPGLIKTQHIGSWSLNYCLNCNMKSYGIHKKKGANFVLLNSELLNNEAINNIKSSDLVSTIFNVIINTNLIEPEINLSFTYPNRNLEKIIKDFNDVVSNFIRREQAAVEERIKKYSDEQYELLDNLKDRAYKERDSLVCIIQKSAKESSFELLSPKSPKLFSIGSEGPFSPKRPKPIKEEKTDFNNEYNSFNEDMMFSFECDDVIEKSNFQNQSLYESENEEEEEEEEEEDEAEGNLLNFQVGRPVTFQGKKSKTSPRTVAKSCPVDIPIFSQSLKTTKNSQSDLNDDAAAAAEDLENCEELDIAASIKALARSVHGDTIFGELPRPKFSSQI